MAYNLPKFALPVPNHYQGNVDLNMAIVISNLLVFPFALISMNYRYSVPASDFYMQAPYKSRTVRYTRLLTGLVSLLASISVAYLLSILVGIIVYTNNKTDDYLNISVLFLAYLAIVGLISLNYLTASFFMWLGNDHFSGIVITFFLYLFLSLIFVGIKNYMTMVTQEYLFTVYPSEVCFSPLYANTIIDKTFGEWLYKSDATLFEDQLNDTISMIGYFVVTVASSLLIFLLKEPSGEYNGKSQPRHPIISYLPHVATLALSLCLMLAMGPTNKFTYLFVAPLSVVILFLFVLLGNKRKPSKIDWIVIACTSVVFLGIFLPFGFILD